MEFKDFKMAVSKNFSFLANNFSLCRVKVGKEDMWNTYLDSFPEGSNEIYKTNREHDCNCCKHFIRTIGNVVAIDLKNHKILTIWDVKIDDPAYQTVADAMATLVKTSPILNIFLHNESTVGVDTNIGYDADRDMSIEWDHFFVEVPSAFVVPGEAMGDKYSEARACHDVFERSLEEITSQSISTVLELIMQNSIYRGEEHKHLVEAFKNVQDEYIGYKRAFSILASDFAWAKVFSLPASVLKFRNSVIGTLAVDISNDVSLEDAVASFEAKVAPENYKRSKSIVTKKMYEDAKENIISLGLGSALERRYAVMTDINVSRIVFASSESKKNMNPDAFDELIAKAPSSKKTKRFDKVEKIYIEKFIKNILPTAESIEVLLSNEHEKNLVSLIAPVDPMALPLFKWNNNFSWTYNGNIADSSIKDKVKKAGGDVSGDLCCRLAWFNTDDLDLHMKEPDGNHINFSNKGISHCGGRLDVDMNVDGETREPVENIFYKKEDDMKEGRYQLLVHNYRNRENIDVGFELEFDYKGTITKYSHRNRVNNHEAVLVVEFDFDHTNGIKIVSEPLPKQSLVKTMWGLQTEEFHKVNVMMLSPNYWNGENGVGNKHYLFMLDGCKNEGPARGFFNEFLRNELNVNRKAFEIVGSKMVAPYSEEQLSGIGFSSTQKNELICRTRGSFSRILKIIF